MRMAIDHLRIVARRLFILKNYGYTLKIRPYQMYRGKRHADLLGGVARLKPYICNGKESRSP